MNKALSIGLRLILIPIKALLLLGGGSILACMFVVGLGRSYLAVILRNILLNAIYPIDRDLEFCRRRHTHILGATGSGKSSAIEYFIDQNIRKGQGVLLIEPHGELCERVLLNKRLSLRHRSQAFQKLRVLDFDQAPPALNFLRLPLPTAESLRASFIDGLSTELAEALCMNMKPSASEAQLIMLRNILMAGFHREAFSFNEVLNILSVADSGSGWDFFNSQPSDALREYFAKDFASPIAAKSKEALRLRLRNLVIPQPLFQSLCADDCQVNFDEILEQRLIVVVKASASLLGSYQAQTIGNIVLNLLNIYAFFRLRRGKSAEPFFVYLDEAQHYVNPAVQRALVGVRKTGLNYTLSHQELQQEGISPAEQRTIVNNTAAKVYGGLQWKDRKEAANILELADPLMLGSLKSGQFLIKAGNRKAALRRFPARFAQPRHRFGQGLFSNAYMSRAERKDLDEYLHEKFRQEPSVHHLHKVTADGAKDIKNLSFSHFDIHGAKVI